MTANVLTRIWTPRRRDIWAPQWGGEAWMRREAFLSDYLENEINDHILGTGVTFPQPSNFLSLHDGHPGETGANELTGGSYARQAAAFNVSAAGLADTAALETWTNIQGAPNEIGFIGSWDALTVGNFLWWSALDGTPSTWTAAAATDILTSYAHGRVLDDRVIVYAWPGSALPTGLVVGTVYWVITPTTDSFQLSATMGGAAINLTTDGEGIAYFVDFRTFNDGDNFQVAAGDLNFQSD